MDKNSLNKDSSVSDSPLHALLRAATRHPHHALDHHPLLAPLTHKPSINDYAAALAGLHGVYATAEHDIQSFLFNRPGLFDYESRRKLPALEADLASLGGTPAPAMESLPPLTNMGTLVGMLYTIEGSTRGGQYIFRHLLQKFGQAVPMAFFAGYGEASDLRWREFWQFADRCCPPSEYSEARECAVRMFEHIRTHLDRCRTAIS